jgi:aminoglycoside phosphotransferase (APT) family kinase protein
MKLQRATPEAAPLQPQRLEAQLRAALPGLMGSMRVAQLGDGGLAFHLGFGERTLLLRTEATGSQLLPLAPALRREYRILEALGANGVPVPRTVMYCDDPQVAGMPFYVAELPEGQAFLAHGLPELAPAQRRGVYFAMAEAMARLHRVDWAAAGLADYARPAHFFAREVAFWRHQNSMPADARANPRRDLARVGEWLAAHLPGDDESAIHHGSFDLGNLIFDASGARVLAMCGWERAALGHPLADVAHSCIAWQLPQQANGVGDLDLARQGIPSQAEFLTHYRQCGGHAEGVTNFHMVFALFRAALAPHRMQPWPHGALARRAAELIDGA